MNLKPVRKRGGGARANFRYKNPFARNHCVVTAYVHCTDDPSADAALALAEKARAAGHLTRRGGVHGLVGLFAWFAREVGMRVAEQHEYHVGRLYRVLLHQAEVRNQPAPERGMWLGTFAKTHPTGRWVVRVHRHAVAVVDGVVYGLYQPCSVVTDAVRLELAAVVQEEAA